MEPARHRIIALLVSRCLMVHFDIRALPLRNQRPPALRLPDPDLLGVLLALRLICCLQSPGISRFTTFLSTGFKPRTVL